MRDRGFVIWLVLRIARWTTWVGFLGYSLVVKLDPSSYLNKFGQLLLSTEACLFGIPMLAVTFGFLELMMRERAGIARPDYFHLMPPSPPLSN
jgi:hypothetical protein